MLRIAIVDSHSLIRQGLRALLNADRRVLLVGEAGDVAGAWRLLSVAHPDVLLLDLDLPWGGLEMCRRVVQAYPRTAVFALTVFLDSACMDACREAGAYCVLPKDAERLCLHEWISHLLRDRAGQVAAEGDYPGLMPEVDQPALAELTAQEIEALRLLALGFSEEGVSRELCLEQGELHEMVCHSLAQMHVSSRVEAVQLLRARGVF